MPDFLCIGAQKAGTTWLHTNLDAHPGVWMPPIKEIHYFDHEPIGLAARLVGRSRQAAKARALLRRRIAQALRGGASREEIAWAARYCLLRRSDHWYESLFRVRSGLVTGEICPGYANLDEEGVARVYRQLPNARVLYLIRNPVERAWSALAMHFRKGRRKGISRVSLEEVEERLLRPKNSRHGEYTRNLAAWESCYPRENVLVVFFDDLRSEPRATFRRILDAIGVESDGSEIPPEVDRGRNTGRGEAIPPGFECVLARAVIDETRRLDARFGNEHTKRWLETTEAML